MTSLQSQSDSSESSTVVNGNVVTTTTQSKTLNNDNTITTTTTIDKTDHGNSDNHCTTLIQTTSSTAGDNSSGDILNKKIIRQIEYYFGDVNMVRDKFLKIESEKNDGWIPLSILTTFNRLKSLTTDQDRIMNALKQSFSGLLQLNESENKIRRDPTKPIPGSQQELESLLKNRTVYVKGFPKSSSITLDNLLQFFEKYGSTDNIQMHRHFKTKEFNGAAFVVFPTDKDAIKFVELSKQTPLIFNGSGDNNNTGSQLECELQEDYLTRKANENGNEFSSYEKRQKDKQEKKDKRKEELNKMTNEHATKLNQEHNLTGALIHITGIVN
ncbi:unnamed protein product [Didymodactylos carnosus]|uniref:Uncharacterized protein n=1 Tax=Didymodactylos carnosus TaxID=1234261 RepID=A0A8S2FZ14_9BILA|nr:unnamed protein product [Didymodactylos carnosus]CAF4366530.1 unnamed protein product [Didymodactylos carnosus]